MFKLTLVVLVLLSFFSCRQREVPQTQSYQRVLMGTLVNITVLVSDEDIKTTVNEAFELIEKLQKEVFDVNEDSSEISKVNKSLKTDSPYQVIKLSDHLYRVFEISQNISKKTDFAFDIRFKTAEELWRASLKEGRLPAKKEIDELKDFLSKNTIELKDANRVKIKSGTLIGLGAIAKGYIMEEAYRFLKSKGLDDFIIDAGGDIKISGSKSDHPWNVSVLDPNPDAETYIAVCRYKNGTMSIATSGSYYRFTEHKGRRYSHIIDTRTATPSESDVLSITVLYPDMSYADAYATALYVEGTQSLRRRLEDLDREGIGVIVVSKKGDRMMNNTAGRYCRFSRF